MIVACMQFPEIDKNSNNLFHYTQDFVPKEAYTFAYLNLDILLFLFLYLYYLEKNK